MTLPPLPFSDAELVEAFPDRALTSPALGRGTYKVAFFADDGTYSVVKILTEPLPPDVEGTDVDASLLPERFAREIRAMQATNSPHLGKISSEPRAVQIGAARYVTYEEPFYSGGTLADRLESGPLSPAATQTLVIELLTAIHELWQARIVHRDIKPGNIVFDATGRSVLIDPGISLHVDLDDLTDSSHSSPMTLGFSAPEQHEARRYAQIDFRTDHFLVGIVGYLALTGTHPVLTNGMDRNTFIIKLLSFNRIDVSSLPGTDELKTVIGRLLAPKPNRRFRSTLEPLQLLGVL